MNRQQLSLVVILGLVSSTPALATSPSEQGGGWRTSSAETGSSTLSGKLSRNSADSSGSVLYVLLDRWGVVRGYVAAARGVELESRLGQQVSLQGTVKTLPGGDMPCLTCQQILGGNAEAAAAPVQQRSVPPRRESIVPAQDRGPRELPRSPPFPRGATCPPIRRRGPRHCRGARSCSNLSRFPRPTIQVIAPARRRRVEPTPAVCALGRAIGQLSRNPPYASSVG